MTSAFFVAIEQAMAEDSYKVCSVCFAAINPSEISLLTYGCFKPDHHDHTVARRVAVRWNHERGTMERIRTLDNSIQSLISRARSLPVIRPMPRSVPLVGRRFILCDGGWRCGGDRCTYAHSPEERDAWNAQLQKEHSASTSDKSAAYGEKIGSPLQPLSLQDPLVPRREYKVPGSHRPDLDYDSNYPPISPTTFAPSQYDMHRFENYNHRSSQPSHHGDNVTTPTWVTSSHHHPQLGRTEAQQQQLYPNHYQQQQMQEQHHQQQQMYQQQQQLHQQHYQQQQLQHHQHGLYEQQTQYQPPVHHQPDPVGSHPWQVQQTRSRRRLQTYPGLQEAYDTNGSELHAPSLLQGGAGQHHYVSRVQSNPTTVNESVQRHYKNAPPTTEDPWPSLGSPTIPRAFPLGSRLPPHSAPQTPADAAFYHPNLSLLEAPPPRAPPHRVPEPIQPPMSHVPQHHAPHPSLPSHSPFESRTVSHGDQKIPGSPLANSMVHKPGDVIYEFLTATNYKNKFQELLKCEESTHKSILENRCNGDYQLVLHQSGLKRPHWMTRESDFRHVRYGYISLSGDQIAYAVQAAQDKEGVTLTYDGNTICTADILSENYSHIEEKLYIGFDRDAVTKLNHSGVPVSPGPSSFTIHVGFKLKHSYFNNLNKYLQRLRPEIIQRLTPDYQSFINHPPNLQMSVHHIYRPYEKLCSPDQLKALKTITLCPPSGPPVLIAGPFGTGKTRVLAVAVRFLFEQPTPFIRILVCTQQRVSADNFLETFLGLQESWNVGYVDAFLVREYGFHNPHLKRYYRNVMSIQHHITRHPQQNRLLLVTTCLTAPHLAAFLRRDYFTHILIDEGAQMREPEAVAPLCLAGSNTMIVIAGDHHQVGPSMLVLGSKARDNGLDKSLLERLLIHYQDMDHVTSNHRVTLVTNYRCHPDILELSGSLFYETPLKPPEDKAPPMLHPDYSSSFLFVCSSFSEEVSETHRNTNKEEAVIILNKLRELHDRWPYREWGDRDLFRACIMSPSRSQLTVISKLIDDRRNGYSKLRSVRRLPTYDMQGREFRFLLLSTSEPTTDDGYIKNPTKSFCDRFVFNTAITRAQSLIVSVGNPFLLLEVEKLMIIRYGEKGKCWSSYLDYCLRNKTISFDESLDLSRTKQKKILAKLREIVKERQSRDYSKDPMTPSTNNNVFSSADEFPPLPQSAAPQTPPPSLPLRNTHSPAQPPTEQPSMASMIQQSPSKPHPPRRSPQDIQLRPQQVSAQPAKQNPWSTQVRNSPNSPQLWQVQTRRVSPLTEQSRTVVHPRARALSAEETKTSGSQQTRPISIQQTRPPGAQQTRPPATQQTRPSGVPQTRPSAIQQTRPLAVRQTRPKSTSQLAASPVHNKQSSQPQPYAALAGKRSEARPSKLKWGDEEDSGLAPGAIESPAEFPPLGASPKGKRKKQRSASQSKQKDRQVPSNSIRDLSSKQTRRREEVKSQEDEDNNDDQVFTHSNTEAILETTADPETKQEVSNTSAHHSHRFEKEFIVKEVLGQGGFGVVFHVKSNFDHSDYALKLTRLPDDNDERLKVMREVRVLAKLVQESHPHVVRYNTSWEEQAPHEWRTRDHWALLETSEIFNDIGVMELSCGKYSHSEQLPIRTTSSSKRDSQSTSGVDTFCHITSSSAATHSSSTVQSIGAATNESSDSFIEFRDDSQRSSNTKRDKAAAPLGKPAASNPDDVFTPHVGSKDNNTVVMNPPMVLMIQTELCEKYTLKDWLSDHIRDRQKRTVVDFFDQMLDALCFIHKERDQSLRFVHRDLKPSNIFFARGKKNFLKIGDFGLVKGTNVDPSVQNPLRDLSSRQQRSPSMNAQGYYAGTPLYMSPEQKQGKACDQKADMYALGVIFFELNCPFKTESERYKVLVQLNEDSENLPKGFRDKLQNEVTTIIQLLMHRNPNMRPSADEIRADKYGELRRLKKKVGKKSKPSLIPVL